MSKRRRNNCQSVDDLRKDVNEELHQEYCNHDLVSYNKPVKVQVHDLSGTTDGVNVSLRCNRCNLLYGYSKYGNGKDGWMLYPEQRKMIEATDVCFVDSTLLQWQLSLACHSWVSFNGFFEAFNEVYNGNFGEKQVAASFWVGEMENELRELGQLDFFGLLKEDGDSSRVLEQIDKIRARSLYEHTSDDCSDTCKERGCGRLWVADGIWKLMFPHCMMLRKNFVKGIPLLNYPNVCTEWPQHGKAFCEQHVQYLEKNFPNVPTSVRGFLRYCGVKPSNIALSPVLRKGLLCLMSSASRKARMW
ncbi:uncharacterized protein LOC124456333 [Xenia sp. Carnegie-2017]|uniref:uncharacterized protein LOC124456333 n=1 Tax=Xenia sp. Carnegie-2017 TaxID=2897299 RepID=UPI001F037D2B|nr:uncharacterized protein LOC124456333 [Xenia sp. Carnegie-2017]